ncbi:MAG: hypothetical protein Ta2E_01070 [Mycoplasmoidaceae bacterium]|nr:MAG: hypothetical protein Ta2E_01070 [Mycoplasmoidaceae bacterium]
MIGRVIENNNETKISIGHILFVCLDRNKTKDKSNKKRRNFNYLGPFVDSENGNVLIDWLNNGISSKWIIVAPINLTKFCAPYIMSIPDNVCKALWYKKPKINILSL